MLLKTGAVELAEDSDDDLDATTELAELEEANCDDERPEEL